MRAWLFNEKQWQKLLRYRERQHNHALPQDTSALPHLLLSPRHRFTLCFADLVISALGDDVRDAGSRAVAWHCQVPVKVVLVASFASSFFGFGLFFLVQAITKLSGENINIKNGARE